MPLVQSLCRTERQRDAVAAYGIARGNRVQHRKARAAIDQKILGMNFKPRGGEGGVLASAASWARWAVLSPIPQARERLTSSRVPRSDFSPALTQALKRLELAAHFFAGAAFDEHPLLAAIVDRRKAAAAMASVGRGTAVLARHGDAEALLLALTVSAADARPSGPPSQWRRQRRQQESSYPSVSPRTNGQLKKLQYRHRKSCKESQLCERHGPTQL